MSSFDALLIKVGDQSYAMPLLQIQEIRGWTPVSALPDTDPACLGVLNLRGHVLPVFDARRILGKPTPEPRPQDVIVVAVLDGKPMGLLVDGVSDIVQIDETHITDPTEDEAWSSRIIDGIATIGEQLVPLLALQKIAGDRAMALEHAAA
jgi:purine-binding chemotaxis protein CheW